jgi:hypothetical protein
MIPKSVSVDIDKYRKRIVVKKERIAKLHRLEKLANNKDLVSEYDALIEQSNATINSIIESKELMDAHKEQVILHSMAQVRFMATGLKNNLCDSKRQIEILNSDIENDNLRISELEKDVKTKYGGII